MLSASNSFISTNWPEVTFSTNFRGKGSAVSERVRPPLVGGCSLWVGSGIGSAGVTLVTAGGGSGGDVTPTVGGVPPVSGTEPSRCGGGSAPSDAKVR